MNQRRKFGPLLTLRQLHLLLKSQASVDRFFGVPRPSDSFYGRLECKRDVSLFSLKQKVRQAVENDIDRFPGRTVPVQFFSPLGTRSLFRAGGPTKILFTPKRKTRIRVRDDDSNVVRYMYPSKMFSELLVGVNIDHSFTVDVRRESRPINFRWHDPSVHPSLAQENSNA
jgi:hypothetical protein